MEQVKAGAPGQMLAGTKVIELGQMLAGPYAGSILADLGAEVVKIERPDGGDDARRMGAAFVNGDSLAFHVFNRGKKSVALNLEDPGDLAAFHALAADCDILINNLRPGVSERFGIDAESMCKRHPRLIYALISAFGHAGPMRMEPGFEPLVQAFSGLSSSNGGPEDPPTRIGASVCDQGTGMWAVISALAMLAQRERTGRGGLLQLSLLETALVWNAQKSDGWVNEGKIAPRHRSGHPSLCPYELFDTGDQPILICCGNDRLFAKLAAVMDQPQWIADPRYATNRQRLLNRDALVDELQPLLRSRLRGDWLEAFKHVGVPCCELHSIADALAHPQVQALGLTQAVGATGMRLTGLPVTVNGHRPTLESVAPGLGEHNAELALLRT
ncbi:CaiB/BaiF CoA transferase family protein [Ottowia thiooxydans]|uniref:Crotonobetainyl-CoA:carnitine CoA-transferase CaiB-like acyl-CoA transferase n=1 Tax=Ottowia thiooxydans TaxID=219182 RepID=A0ABV2QCD2_9BURK